MDRRYHTCSEQGEAYGSRVFTGANNVLYLEKLHFCLECRKENSCVTEIAACPFCGKNRGVILNEVSHLPASA